MDKKKKHSKSSNNLTILIRKNEEKLPTEEQRNNIAIINQSSLDTFQLSIRFNDIINRYDQLEAKINKPNHTST
jgi:hypothetical protein